MKIIIIIFIVIIIAIIIVVVIIRIMMRIIIVIITIYRNYVMQKDYYCFRMPSNHVQIFYPDIFLNGMV